MIVLWAIFLLAAITAGLALIAPARKHVGVMGVTGVLAAVAVTALAVYLPRGNPEMPGAPFAAAKAERAGQDPASMNPSQQFKRLEDLVRERPDDATARIFYARELLRRKRNVEAVEAYRAAAKIEPDAAIFTEMGEALIVLNEGQVTPEARAAFRQALSLDETSLSASFYLAAADYDADPNSDTALALARIPALAGGDDSRSGQLAAAVAARLTRPRAGPKTGAPPPSSPEDMVGGLAQRASANPDDIGLWLSLARVQGVLWQTDVAMKTLETAEARFGDQPGPARVIEAVRNQLEALPAPEDDP